MKIETLINGKKITNEDGTITFIDRFNKSTTYENLDEYLEKTKVVQKELDFNKIFKNW